jgi:hypothetical protein
MPKPNMERRDMPLQTRDAAVLPKTINDETRSIELVWSTGARVRRFDWWEGRYYEEEISLDPKHVDLARLENGAPLLNSHHQWGLEGQIGVVERAWLEKGEARAIVRFSKRDEVTPIWADVKDGVVRNVSVGYSVRKYEIVKEEGKLDLYRAVDWTPLEISLVSIPADAGAGTRGETKGEKPEVRTYPCEIVNRADAAHNPEGTMPEPKKNDTAAPADPAITRSDPNPGAAPTPASDAARQEEIRTITAAAVAAERTRVSTIRTRCRTAGLDDKFADGLIDRGIEGEHIGNAIFDEMAKRGGDATQPRITGGADHTDPVEIRSRMVEALSARASEYLPAPGRIAMTERARDFANMGLLDLGIELARAHGDKVSTRMAPAAMYNHLLQRQLSTSDFPILLMDASNKMLAQAYAMAAPSYKEIFQRNAMRDFKPHNLIRAGDFPNLLAKGETGEFQYGSIGESKEQLVLASWGRIVSLSRRVLINDDLNAFAKLPAMIAERVAAFENATAYAVLTVATDGPTLLETGRKLFNTTDKTLAGSGAAISITTVSTGRENIRQHKSLDGLPLNLVPDIILTSPANETVAEQFCNTVIVAATDATANPFKGKLKPIADAALSGNNWYLFASGGGALAYGHLEGAEGPQVMSREGFTTEGLDVRVMLDFVAGAIGFRGCWKNPQS